MNKSYAGHFQKKIKGDNMANQHITTHPDGGWQVQGEGNERATFRSDTQQEAIDRGREIARNQNSELIIHGRNGKIRDRDSYGNDPFPPKG